MHGYPPPDYLNSRGWIIIEFGFNINNNPNTASHTDMMPLSDNTAPTPRRPKGELARERLKAAAVSLLDRVGYHQLRVKDITTEAGVAAGLFHHYRVAVQAHAAHPGIMRCIDQFCVDDPAFRARWQASYNRRLKLLAAVFPYVFPNSDLNEHEVNLVVHALSGIGQEVLRTRYIERNADLLALGLSEDELAEWLAALFYRGLFACNPPRRVLNHADRILSLKR